MDPTHFTTAQKVPLNITIKDGFGKVVPIDGAPVAALSDDTVASVANMTANPDGSYSADLIGGVESPDTQRVTLTADVDLGPDVKSAIGVLEFVVDHDPRSDARIVAITAGAPVDK